MTAPAITPGRFRTWRAEPLECWDEISARSKSLEWLAVYTRDTTRVLVKAGLPDAPKVECRFSNVRAGARVSFSVRHRGHERTDSKQFNVTVLDVGKDQYRIEATYGGANGLPATVLGKLGVHAFLDGLIDRTLIAAGYSLDG